MRTRELALFTAGVAALAMFVGCSSGSNPAEDDETSLTEVAPLESAPDASPTSATDEPAPQAVDLNLVTECPPIVNQFSPASDTVYTSIAVPVELLGFAPTTQPTCVRGRPLADGTPRRDYFEMIWVTHGLDPIISFERQLIAAGWPIREGYTEAGDPATAVPFYTWLSPNGAQDMVIANHANPNGVIAVGVVFNSQAP